MPSKFYTYFFTYLFIIHGAIAQNYSIGICNNRLSNTSSVLQIPRNDEYKYYRFSAIKLHFNNNEPNSIFLSKKLNYKLLKEISIEYQNIKLSVLGPNAIGRISNEFIERKFQINKLNLKFMLINLHFGNMFFFSQIGISNILLPKHTQNKSKSIRRGKYKLLEDIVDFRTSALIPLIPEVDFGLQRKLFDLNKNQVYMRVGCSIGLYDAFDFKIHWPDKQNTIISETILLKSLFFSLIYSL